MTPLDKARAYGTLAHAKAGVLYEGQSFEVHLAWVERVLRYYGYGLDDSLLQAAWLHDTIEDCGIRREAIEQEFGARVADLVWAVTDAPWGRDRNEKKYWAYIKTRSTPGAIQLKLADRIANVQSSLKPEHVKYFHLYRSEQHRFKCSLYRQGEHDDMWHDLEQLLGVKE